MSVARTLERCLFDAFSSAKACAWRENRGRIHSLVVAGRAGAITQPSALAGAVERIGLAATQNTTYNYLADLAHRLASLDFLSGGRAGWNIVTTDNARTGTNFRRGGWPAHERRYERATQFFEAAKAPWSRTGPGRPTPTSSGCGPRRRCHRARKPAPCCSRQATPPAAENRPPATRTTRAWASRAHSPATWAGVQTKECLSWLDSEHELVDGEVLGLREFVPLPDAVELAGAVFEGDGAARGVEFLGGGIDLEKRVVRRQG
ncbi:LLM class flavin-dependent oxidoreductase [Amycolatopsis sp. FDAARGOS 1241]|uniref:LLM class flavin-dependent oxidoreductase n=1 Tax=Amycolatopsis sp. FDAARGOS 1241 TaxID=2778070 RepID=UPI001EF2AED1|nr:LLM class flavin-dependent oxidoreductase [Amycolatopsis sp. FDAARGOS 1241]